MHQLGRVLLNIGRMGPGRADYYLTAVARGGDGVEGYYLARGEEPGRWLGHGSESLGLSGEVTGEQLRAVLDARHPATGDRLATHPARKVPGFDHTFRAPKSVSLLWALGDRATAEQVVAAHDVAVDAAIGYLQRAAGFSRRGAGGAESVGVDGFVAAAFRHRTSRADDPLLHTHVLVANLARTTDDGVWRTLDSRKLYAHAKTAGVLYQAQLRHELTARLGVAWQPVVNGHADIDGVDRGLIETFSQRRAQIVAHLRQRGESSAAAAQTATLATRQAKGEHASEAELRDVWIRRAAAVGVTPGWHRQLIGNTSWEPPDVAGLWQQLVLDEGLTQTSSSFTRRDVLQQLAGRLPAGAPVRWCERVAEVLLTHDTDLLVALGPTRGHLTAVDVIHRDDGRIVPIDRDEPRYTTRGLLLTDQRATNRSLTRHNDQSAIAKDPAVVTALRRRTLTDEQTAMVRRLTTAGAGVEVVVGKAGTGKTYALDAAREAWEASGIRVTGVALAARAALELEASAGIRATTLARILGQLDDHREGSPLQPGSVLVVDEAGMIGTRQLARLLDHTETQQVKVVLVGDPRQLPEIDAGGLFRALTSRLPAIELTDNRRQNLQWEQAALDELRHGNPDTALATYKQHDRIHTAATPEQLRARLVDDWWETAKDDLPGSIMIALRRDDVADLNHHARIKMAATGRLTGPKVITAEEIELQTGDRIVCLRNHRRLSVTNGTRATITRINVTSRAVEAIDDHGRSITLPSDYLDAGHVTHGYAITGHKAQGLTCDHTYTLSTETLYREWGYVAMSRGRLTNQLYHGPTHDHDDGLHHHVHHNNDEVASLASRLRRTRAETPLADQPDTLGADVRRLEAFLTRADVQLQRDLAELHDEFTARHAREQAGLQALDAQLAGLARGLRGLTHREQRDELLSQRRWQQHTLAQTATRLVDLDRQLADLPDPRQIDTADNKLRRLRAELYERAETAVTRYEMAPPRWLIIELGTPPSDPHARTSWRATACALERHRLRWKITDPDQALGTEIASPTQSDEQRCLRQRLHETREQLYPQVHRHRRRGLSR